MNTIKTNNKLSIKTHLKNCWDLVNGSKWPIWAPVLVSVVMSFVISLVVALIVGLLGIPGLQGGFTVGYSISYIVMAFILQIIIFFAIGSLIAGAQMVALKRYRGENINAGMGFGYWSLWLKIGLTFVLFMLGYGLLNVVFGFIILLASYAGSWLSLIFELISIAATIVYYALFFFSILFVVDKKQEPVEALKNSYDLVKPQLLDVSKIFALVFVGFIVIMIPWFFLSLSGIKLLSFLGFLISAGIAVWGLPYFHLLISGAYHKLTKK